MSSRTVADAGDRPRRVWFRETSRWSFLPVAWPGWALTVVYTALVVVVSIISATHANERKPAALSIPWTVAYLTVLVGLTAGMMWAVFHTAERLPRRGVEEDARP